MNGKEVFFIDEIYARTVKTFKEAVMCTKLLRPNIYVDKVRVAISIVLEDKDVYGIQFHPEVHHTPKGSTIFENFYEICKKV